MKLEAEYDRRVKENQKQEDLPVRLAGMIAHLTAMCFNLSIVCAVCCAE